MGTVDDSGAATGRGSTRVYCSELARSGDAELAGTMGRIDVWVLIEVARPWPARVLEDNELPEPVRDWLGALAGRVQEQTGDVVRVLFVKQRTSMDTPGVTLSVALSREDQALLYRFEVARYRDLLAIDVADVVRSAGSPRYAAHRLDTPVFLVCTNGRRDLCCARFGRPVFEALATEFGERVWQTSHIGGHRYAPNVVCLPQGSVYGFAGPDAAVDIVRAELDGHVTPAHLRGRTCHDTPVQACEVFLRRRLGLTRRDALRLCDSHLDGDRVEARFEDGDGTRHRVQLARGVERAQASCGDAGPKDVECFRWAEGEDSRDDT